MAYELHIERLAVASEVNLPISFEEWRSAVATVPGVRPFAETFHVFTVPNNGATVRTPAGEGDAEVYFPNEQTWHSVFRMRAGVPVISFNAWFEPGDKTNPVWVAATALASLLGASIRGDEGEDYDLQTGAIMPPRLDSD